MFRRCAITISMSNHWGLCQVHTIYISVCVSVYIWFYSSFEGVCNHALLCIGVGHNIESIENSKSSVDSCNSRPFSCYSQTVPSSVNPVRTRGWVKYTPIGFLKNNAVVHES